MAPTDQLKAFAQSVYLVIKNRYYDDLNGVDGQVYLSQVIDWTNQYIDELESEVGSNGEPINWSWVRQNGYTLGTALLGATSLAMPSGINNILTDERRFVQIIQNGKIVSDWAVVAPGDIGNVSGRPTDDACAVTGQTIQFSRAFRDTEAGGTITGDITTPIPRLSTTNLKALTLVKPKQLLILGVAKNATLPDIVQGGLSPSYTQKYGDLLKNAVARNEASMLVGIAQRDNYGYIGGVGF